MPPKLLIRSDASEKIGLGHVMRCLALAQSWIEHKGSVTIVCSQIPENLRARFVKEGISIRQIPASPGSSEDAEQTSSLAIQECAEWIVVDGYHFLEIYYSLLKNSGQKILSIDDTAHLDNYPVDAILNQNFQASKLLYKGKTPKFTQLLLGPKFSLVRKEFRNYANRERATPSQPKRILISFGGSDLENVTTAVLTGLMRSHPKQIDVRILAGAANTHIDSLSELCKKQDFPCELLINVENVADMMAWADCAISGAGSTIWELFSMRLPAFIIGIAENQMPALAPIAAYASYQVIDRKALSSIDWHQYINSLFDRIVHKSDNDHSILPSDLWGADRTVLKLKGFEFQMRQLVASDCQLIYDINNDAEIRALAFKKKSIDWESHLIWFERRIIDPNFQILIFETSDGQLIGTIRFEINSGEAIVSIVILPIFRGLGAGPEMLNKSCRWLFQNMPVKSILAVIKEDNPNSISCFTTAGFREDITLTIEDVPVKEYRLIDSSV